MNKKRSTGSGKTTGNRNTRSRSLRTSIRRLPSWMRWGGAVVITAFYVWAFYYFFVIPFGFRWRALFGEPDYPQGYEIHGIDISHHQGKIDWSELRNAMIAKCPLRFVMIKATEGSGRERTSGDCRGRFSRFFQNLFPCRAGKLRFSCPFFLPFGRFPAIS